MSPEGAYEGHALCRPVPKLKLHELFHQWFNLPETRALTAQVLEEAAKGDGRDGRAAALRVALPADPHSPPGSPTANGMSSLSLVSPLTPPRTPPKSPDMLSREAARAVLGDSVRKGSPRADPAVKLARLQLPLGHERPNADLSVHLSGALDDVHALLPLEHLGGHLERPGPGAAPCAAPECIGAVLCSPHKRPLPQPAAGLSQAPAQTCKKQKDVIAPFYTPLGRQPQSLVDQELTALRAALDGRLAPDGPETHVASEGLAAALKAAVGLPLAAGRVVAARLGDGERPGLVDKGEALAFAGERLCGLGADARVFAALHRGPGAHLEPGDIRQVAEAVVRFHPGLSFLEATPDFQERYVDTVVLRVLYATARCGPRRVSRGALARTRFADALALLDREEEVNRCGRFFSYEHFYVIYCKFWELDDDHDMRLSREDLGRYDNYALSARITDRVFDAWAARPGDAPRSGAATAPRSPNAAFREALGAAGPEGPGKKPLPGSEPYLDYAGFVWFVLSEEDKTSATALEYWFRLVDLDGDGYISGFELAHFYTEQHARMMSMGQEPVLLGDVACQLFDMVRPAEPARGVSLADLKRSSFAGRFLDVLFNLNKFLSWEMRDPHAIREERLSQHLTDWERFCRREYTRLVMEDDGGAGAGAGEAGAMGAMGADWEADVALMTAPVAHTGPDVYA
mmetsp:Transcript_7932/g.26910  ORF Transcript_7932/g.26910 Transcript_7932/m.26910 type:complete len:688 (-) Transcript_7932:403-2466(-)